MAVQTVAILVFPETTASVIYGLYDLLRSAGRDWEVITLGTPGVERIRPVLVARDIGPQTVTNDILVNVKTSLDDCPDVAVVVVPEVNLPPGSLLADRFRREVEWLVSRYAAGTILAAGCSGAMLFAEAGLLDGYPATTHWAWCDAMQQRFSRIDVQRQRALVVTGEAQRLIMAGGGASYLDLALYLIARLTDVETAMQVARINLIDWHHIGQQPFARLAQTRQVEDAMVGRCQSWIAQHYDQSSPVSRLVEVSGVAERTLARRFQQATGMTPLEYIQALRLEEAKHLLETSDESIDGIAAQVGYEDAGYFSRLFKRRVQLTPAQYRKRFGVVRRALRSVQQ